MSTHNICGCQGTSNEYPQHIFFFWVKLEKYLYYLDEKSVLFGGLSHTPESCFFSVQDERCSFPIQMWNYYLRGVQYDMWTICPPKLSQRMFGAILHDSLQILTQRYCQAKPSFRRVHQFR